MSHSFSDTKVVCFLKNYFAMAELGVTGKRIRKKPKYLRDDDEEVDDGGGRWHSVMCAL